MKRLLIAALLVLTPTVACAHPWYAYDAANNSCHDASTFAKTKGTPVFSSPMAFRDWARTRPNYGGFKVRHIGGGVSVAIHLGNSEMIFMSKKALCESYSAFVEKTEDLNALK